MRSLNKGGSFGILELLVVMVLILVIAAVVFPMFVRHGERVRPSTCQVNLKECALALQLYTHDYDGHLPSSALVNGSEKWNRDDFVTFATRTGNLPAKGKQKTWVQLLYSHMKNKDIMFCPSDTSDRTKPDVQTSYWYKVAVDRAWYGDRCKKPCRKATDFIYDADQIVFYERKGWHFGDTRGLKNGVQIKVVYLDTHMRTIALVNSTEDYTNSPTAPGEPRYFNFDNNKPKGPGNPPSPKTPAGHIDPNRYSDMLQ